MMSWAGPAIRLSVPILEERRRRFTEKRDYTFHWKWAAQIQNLRSPLLYKAYVFPKPYLQLCELRSENLSNSVPAYRQWVCWAPFSICDSSPVFISNYYFLFRSWIFEAVIVSVRNWILFALRFCECYLVACIYFLGETKENCWK